MSRHSLLIAALLCSPAALYAETVYVTDSLRLGIHVAEDQSGSPFENLASGTPVEVLKRKGAAVRVRLSDGREGWARATYLVPDKPAAATADLESRGGTLNGLDSPTLTSASGGRVPSTMERRRVDARRYEEQLEAYRYSMPLWLAGALALIALAGGFTAGIWWLDLRMRRRHGGFRIY